MEENKYDIIKKFTKKTTTESTNDDQFLNKNVTGNSSKYISSDVVTSSPRVENIYDHVKNCDTIQVVPAETELENKPDANHENPPPKVKTTSERLLDKSHQKGKQLKEKIKLRIFSKSRNTNEAKTEETDDGHCRGENSLVRRFMV